MLHNIVFTDNIFILSRMLSSILQSLELDFSEELFTKKLESDIIFCSEVTRCIFEKLSTQEQLHDYLDSIKCLYSCSTKLLQILTDVTTSDKNLFLKSPETITRLQKQHTEIKANIAKKIHNTNVDSEVVNIVSEAEMTELLNFNAEPLAAR